MQGLRPADAVPSDAASAVSSLLVSLRECGSVAVQCESVLSPGAESDEGARLCALECVRELSPAALGGVSEPEASLFGVLKDHLCGAESDLSCEERLSCWLALFVLGCRNGVAVVARVDVAEPTIGALLSQVTCLGAAVTSGNFDAELRVAAAATQCALVLVAVEGGCKATPDVRAPLGTRYLQQLRLLLAEFGQAFTTESISKVIARMIELRLLEREGDEEVSLGCGTAQFVCMAGIRYDRAIAECDSEALFGGGLVLLRRVR